MNDRRKMNGNPDLCQDGPDGAGCILKGITGSVVGMILCILVMFLCILCRAGGFGIMSQFFAGMVIGWFYRLFHGPRSKRAACVTVGICTLLSCVLWVVLLALFPVFIFAAPLTAVDWGELWRMTRELQLLCAGLGMFGFFFTRAGDSHSQCACRMAFPG